MLPRILQEGADEDGRSSGFIKRVREFRGSTFAQTLILGQMQEKEASLSELAHFAQYMNVKVTGQAIEKRFTQTTALFFEKVLHRAFSHVVAADPVAIDLLKRFSEVIVEDSSTISLPDGLKEIWQGCGGNQAGTLSALKIHVRWDLLSGALTNLALGAARQPDLKSPFKPNRRQRRSVRIADLGYFDTKQFEEESAAGEYWISRVKVGNLVICDEQGNPLDLVTFCVIESQSFVLAASSIEAGNATWQGQQMLCLCAIEEHEKWHKLSAYHNWDQQTCVRFNLWSFRQLPDEPAWEWMVVSKLLPLFLLCGSVLLVDIKPLLKRLRRPVLAEC